MSLILDVMKANKVSGSLDRRDPLTPAGTEPSSPGATPDQIPLPPSPPSTPGLNEPSSSWDTVIPLQLTPKSWVPTDSEAKSNETWIDTHEAMLDFLPILSKYQKDIPDGAFDLEGVNLSRDGKLTHLSLTIKSQESHTWIIDYQALGSQVLDMNAPGAPSLREILEDPERVSLWFDLRNDADALFSHGNMLSIRKGHPRDIQLMELVTRLGSRHGVHSLKVCMQEEGIKFMRGAALKNWLTTKQDGREYFDRYGWEVLEQRPLPKMAKSYTAGDTKFLFDLHDVYAAKMPEIERQLQLNSGDLMRLVDQISMERAIESESPDYVPNGPHKKLTPPAILELEEMYPWGPLSSYFPPTHAAPERYENNLELCGVTAILGTLFGAFKNLFTM
jgi:exonuclease 3'-5' domain-containing protein 1